MTDPLHADAVRLLTGWQPPSLAVADWKQTLALLERGPAVMAREHAEGHMTASGIVVDEDRRALLCLHGRFNIWVQLGGHCEPGDVTLAGVALRESTEESGIEGLVVDPVPVDVDVHEVRCGGGPLNRHHDVIFVLRAPAGAVPMVSAESHELGWFGVDELPSPLGTDTDRVVRSALARLG